jgi:hypothetical protein
MMRSCRMAKVSQSTDSSVALFKSHSTTEYFNTFIAHCPLSVTMNRYITVSNHGYHVPRGPPKWGRDGNDKMGIENWHARPLRNTTFRVWPLGLTCCSQYLLFDALTTTNSTQACQVCAFLYYALGAKYWSQIISDHPSLSVISSEMNPLCASFVHRFLL